MLQTLLPRAPFGATANQDETFNALLEVTR